jgi:hypothetical protein
LFGIQTSLVSAINMSERRAAAAAPGYTPLAVDVP